MPQVYSKKIIDHYHHPLNTGKLANAKVSEGQNPLCGDEILVYLKTQDNKIKNIKYQARGCMITVASASLLSEFVKGKPITAVKKITKKNIDKLLGVTISNARAACATLALDAIKQAFNL